MSNNILTPWRRFVKLLQLERRDIKQIFFYAIFAGLVALSLPLGIQAIINLIQGAQVSTSWIVLVVLVTLGVAFQGVLQLMQIRLLENVQQRIFTRSSFEFAYRFPRIKFKELHNIYPPELANRFFDTLTVQKGLSKILLDFPAAILQIVFGLMLLSFYHPFFIFYGILLVLLIYLVFKFTAKRGLETSLKESKVKYQVAHWLQEVARSLTDFKLSRGSDLAMQTNDKLTKKYLENRESHFRILLWQFGQMIGFKVLVTAGLLSIGGLLVLNQQMNIGQFVAAEIIILLVINSVEKLVTGLETFYDTLTSLEKLGQVVDRELENDEGSDPYAEDNHLELELENIHYVTEDGTHLLKDISLDLGQNERVYIKGSSGSGKSTLLKVLGGVFLPNKGSFYINDTPQRMASLSAYRAKVGMLTPEQSLFEGTIRDNITLGLPVEDKTWMHDVLEKLGIQNYIKGKDKGLDTMLYDAGRQLPSTLARRILLARAILHKPKILLLKDSVENFSKQEGTAIAKFIADPSHEWSLVVSGVEDIWQPLCKRTIILDDGQITKTEDHA